jgi:hypothetical protein
MRTRYFVRRPGSEPLYVFRLPGVAVELYDVAEHAWRAQPLEPLYRWALLSGEDGVDEISADEATTIIRTLDRAPNIRHLRRLRREERLLRRPPPGSASVFYADDEPQFTPAGDFLTVKGVLESLGVQGASRKKQRAAIARVITVAALRPFLEKLAPQLHAHGLLDSTPSPR